jgi:hypothetical protein
VRLGATALRRFHAIATTFWLITIPLSLATGWIYSLVFVSAISLYANVASHFAAWQGARAEEAAE